VDVVKVNRRRVAACLLALMVAVGPATARDWRWYPKRQAPDADALRPDLEGTRGDDTSSGTSDLEEMRQWLYRRDVERRERGFSLPDTVEQLEPGGGLEQPPARQWSRPPPPLPPPRSRAGGFEGGGTRDRVRDVFSVEPGMEPPTGGFSDGAETLRAEAADAVPERRAWSGKHRRRGKGAHRSRSRSGAASKSRSGKRRHR